MFLLLFILNIGLVGMNYGNFRPHPLGSRGGPGSPLLGISRKGHQNKTLFGIFLKTDKSDWAKTIFNLIVPFLRSFWVVTWLFCDNFSRDPKWPKIAKNGQNGPKMTKNDLNVWKMTFETIAIKILPLLLSFWVVTWLVCDNFFTGRKMAKNDQKWLKNDMNV